MNCLKRIWLVSMVAACVLIASPVMAMDPSEPPEEAAAWQQYKAEVMEALLAEGTPRAMALAATLLLPVGENANANTERRRELFAQAAQRAPDDAEVQWLVAVNAPSADRLSDAAGALQRLEPDNGAVWLFALNAAYEAEDSNGVTEALARIGASTSFDDHFGLIAMAWLNFFRTQSKVETPEFGEDREFTSLPLVMALVHSGSSSIGIYRIFLRACGSANQPALAERREACLAAGRLIWKESDTMLSQMVGAGLLRKAGVEDAAEISRELEYFREEYRVLVDKLRSDPQEFEHYQNDWLQTRSEVQVGRNAMARAGIPLLPPADWQPAPNPYVTDEGKAKAD